MSKLKLANLLPQEEEIFQTIVQNNDCHNKIHVESSPAATDTFIPDDTYHFMDAPIMNDVFTQEANFVIPTVQKSWTTQIINTNSTLTPPIFTAPHSVCMKPTFEEDATHWPSTGDLLELDHRYNSCLQTDLLHNENTTATTLADLTTYIDCREKPLNAQKPQQQQHPTQQLNSAKVSSDSESDFEDRNLSWLLNFKFDEFPHLSPDTTALNTKNKINSLDMTNLNIQTIQRNYKKSNSCSPAIETGQLNQCQKSDGLSSPMKVGKKFEELVMEATSEMDCNEVMEGDGVILDDMAFRMGKKPPFTYTELIEYALEDKGELTVSGIYQWISDRFPYYKSNDDRWKNSVRHNLSINPHFRKGAKASQGAGHLWTISSGDSAESVLAWEHKKQRLELFFKMETANIKRIQQHQLKQQNQQQLQQQQNSTLSMNNSHVDDLPAKCYEDEAATAADIITREMLQQPTDTTNCVQRHPNNEHAAVPTTTQFVQELPFNDLICEEELRRAAGQILNGIHREVEVQSVNSLTHTNYQNVLMESDDYLCENVLQHTNYANLGNPVYSNTHPTINNISSQFNITEIDPMELGIQMSHHVDNEEILFNDELGLNFFGYTVNSDIAT